MSHASELGWECFFRVFVYFFVYFMFRPVWGTLSVEEGCVAPSACGSPACECAPPWGRRETTAIHWATRWGSLLNMNFPPSLHTIFRVTALLEPIPAIPVHCRPKHEKKFFFKAIPCTVAQCSPIFWMPRAGLMSFKVYTDQYLRRAKQLM